MVDIRGRYYDPHLLQGLKLGWVPIEEYAFFVVRTVLAGLVLRGTLLAAALATAWLTAADSVALRAGTWTIAPHASLGLFLPGHVPVEEGVFFLVTNLLIAQALLLLQG